MYNLIQNMSILYRRVENTIIEILYISIPNFTNLVNIDVQIGKI